MNSTVVGLDIGTTKVTAVVGEMIDDARTKVIGMGFVPSRGMEKGLVKNVDETTACIQEAIEKAQRMADMAIDYVYIGIAGGHIQSINRTVEIDLPESHTSVTQEDVDLILSMAKDIKVPDDKEIIHTIIREYTLDENRGLMNPVGMAGSKLKVSVHIVLGAVCAIKDLVRCAHNVNLDVAEVILQPLASAEAILTDDEKKMGVVLVDIGGGTTDIAVFKDGQLTHTKVIPVGGGHFTKDLSVYLRSSHAEAEKLKVRYGSVDLQRDDLTQSLEVPAVGGDAKRTVTVGAVADVLRARGEELVELVLEDIFNSVGDLRQFGAGIVLTGGGSQTRGLDSLFKELGGLPVRIGRIKDVTGLVEKVSSPVFATGVGLIFYGYRNHELVMRDTYEESIFERVLSTVKGWFY